MLINPGSPLETVLLNSTLSDLSSGSAKEESVWKIVVPIVCGVAAAVVGVLLLLLVKRGVIRKLLLYSILLSVGKVTRYIYSLTPRERYIGPILEPITMFVNS